MPVDVLEEILESRRAQLLHDKNSTPVSNLESRIKSIPAPRDFEKNLVVSGHVGVIAEMKRRSPSAGLIREDFNVSDIALAYEKAGVKALSILTEPVKFGGKMEDILTARTASQLPILRKDFIFEPYQIIEARAAGADAVLLIADMLAPAQLNELVACARHYSLAPLVEIFTENAVEPAIRSNATLIGINTRNLRTLEMVPDNVTKLAVKLPKNVFIVAESGIKTAEEIQLYRQQGISAVLVGESLLKQKNLERAARILVEAGQ